MKWTAYCLDCQKDVLNGEQWANGEMVEGQARFHIHGEGQHHDCFLNHKVIVGFIVEHRDDCYCNRKKSSVGADGRLEKWEIHQDYLVGCIYDDAKGRFPNGLVIHTSAVIELVDGTPIKKGDVVTTKNSHYLLGDPA